MRGRPGVPGGLRDAATALYVGHDQRSGGEKMATGGKLENLTQPTAVEKAMEEFRVLGRDAFIEKYGFGVHATSSSSMRDVPTTASP